MVNMTNRPNVQVRLVALELLFRHGASPSGVADVCVVGSGGGTRTRDPTIMSRVLLPTELLRRAGRAHRPAPASPLTDSNRRPLPYHGSALPTELRGRSPSKVSRAGTLRPRRCVACVRPCRRPSTFRTRLVERRDAEALRAIYNVEVLESTVTFDLVPRIARRAARVDRRALGRPPGDRRGRRRRRGRAASRRLTPVSAPAGVRDHRRGLGLRAPRPPRARASAGCCSATSSTSPATTASTP